VDSAGSVPVSVLHELDVETLVAITGIASAAEAVSRAMELGWLIGWPTGWWFSCVAWNTRQKIHAEFWVGGGRRTEKRTE
jgi:hypothetical protein